MEFIFSYLELTKNLLRVVFSFMSKPYKIMFLPKIILILLENLPLLENVMNFYRFVGSLCFIGTK